MAPLKQNCTVGVIGAGTMGVGIAQVAALAGHDVLVHDLDAGLAGRAVAQICARVQGQVEKGRIDASTQAAVLDRLRVMPDIEALNSSALVIEAIAESLEAKQLLLRRVENVVPPDAVIASNTSALSITAIASALERPERFLGLHFFNPPPVMPLVEVVSGIATDPRVSQQAVETMTAWGKVPIRASSTPGFIVNRIARPFYGEAFRALEEQIGDAATIDAVMRDSGGFRMGPLELTDLIGQDVNDAVNRSVWEGFAFDPRYAPSRVQRSLVESGRLGRKSGQGFYDYLGANGAPRPQTAGSATRPSAIRVVGDIGPLAPLVRLAEQAGIAVRPTGAISALQQGFLEIGHGLTRLMITDGRLATEIASRIGRRLVLLDASNDFTTAERVALAPCDGCPPDAVEAAVGLMQAIGKEVSLLEDVAGLLVMRTVAMLVNEAADVVGGGLASPADVDLAMRKGVNYPHGPLELGDRLGPGLVVRVLDNLSAVYRDGRYRACPLLRRCALSGARLAT